VVAPPVLGLAAKLRGRATPEVMRPQAINHAGTRSRQIHRLELAVFQCSFRRRSRLRSIKGAIDRNIVFPRQHQERPSGNARVA
jgi:hypothetical protein